MVGGQVVNMGSKIAERMNVIHFPNQSKSCCFLSSTIGHFVFQSYLSNLYLNGNDLTTLSDIWELSLAFVLLMFSARLMTFM